MEERSNKRQSIVNNSIVIRGNSETKEQRMSKPKRVRKKDLDFADHL